MGRQRFAGADRAVHDILPSLGIMKRTENHAADQLLVIFCQGFGQNGGIFGHKADGAKLNARKARFSVLFEHCAANRGCAGHRRIPHPKSRAHYLF